MPCGPNASERSGTIPVSANTVTGGFQVSAAPKESAIVARTREISEAVDDLRGEIERRLPIPVPELRGYVSQPSRPRALSLGLRLCVDVEAGTSLAQKLRPVPAEYVTEADGVVTVRCRCGETHVRAELHECAGCDRWFVGDASGVWAVRLPTADEAA
jgi:hypothetical protein